MPLAVGMDDSMDEVGQTEQTDGVGGRHFQPGIQVWIESSEVFVVIWQ